MALLDDSDRQRIEAAIGALEKRTAAEVVVAVVGRSSHPWAARVVSAFTLALGGAIVFLEFAPALDARLVVVVEMVVAAVAFALFGLPPLERLLVARAAARRDVEEHAFALFSRRGLYRTRSHSGVLLLVSELERQVVILGDEGIHGRLGQEGWQAHVDHVIAAIRRGEAARGILEVLERLGPVLAELAPAGEQNDDELPNAVIQEP